MVYTGTDLNKAEIGYVDEQDQVIQDQVISNLKQSLPDSFKVLKRFNLDDDYHQAVAVDGTYFYMAEHNNYTSPNLKMTKIDFNGNTILTVETATSVLFDDLSDWDISDWHWKDDYLWAVFGHKSTGGYATKIIKIDPSDFSLVETVYSSNSTDGNANYYGEGIFYHNDLWWISYEAYTSGDVDYIDTFNSDWEKQTRYTIEGINTDNIPRLGVNHVQGIVFYNGLLWFTIHPQEAYWAYRGALVAASLQGTTFTVQKVYDLSTDLDDAVGEGLAIWDGVFYLNGIDSLFVGLSYDKNFVTEPLITNIEEESSVKSNNFLYFPRYGEHYVETSYHAVLDTSNESFTILGTISLAGSQTNQAGIFTRRDTSTSDKYALLITAENKLFFNINDGSTSYSTRCEKVLEVDKTYRIAIVFDKTLNQVIFYINGILYKNDYVSGDITALGSINNNGALYFGRYYDYYFYGSISRFALFKRALSASEAKLYSYAPLSNAVSRYRDTTFSTTDFSNAAWTKTASVTSSGAMTFTTNAAGGVYYGSNNLLTGKRYRLTATFTCDTTLEIRKSSSNATVLATSSVVVDFIASTDTGPYIRLNNAGTVTFTELELIELESVVRFLPENINHKQWHDKGFYKLIGEYKGSDTQDMPKGLVSKNYQYKQNVHLNTTLTHAIPAGGRISSIILKNTTTNAVTGGIKIGTTSGGEEVVATVAVGSGAYIDCTLVKNLFETKTSLYINAVTDWNGAYIDLIINYTV